MNSNITGLLQSHNLKLATLANRLKDNIDITVVVHKNSNLELQFTIFVE